MKTILIPVDFSGNSQKALAAAKLIADKTGARLLIMYVYQPFIDNIALPEYTGSLPIYQQLEDSYREKLAEMVFSARHQGYRAEAVWETDGVQPAILKRARENAADLVVMGRSGQGGFLDKLIGSSATGIALDAHCPVLIIPPQARIREFKKIVYATQLEFDEKNILLDVMALIRQLKAHLTLLKINSDEQLNIQPDGQFIAEIRQLFNIPSDDIIVKTADSVMNGLEDYCDEAKADLLVVCNRDRNFLQVLLNGKGLTRKLSLDTHLPLLVYHSKQS